ncbi:MAG TPA: bifunctional methylenetetrahydrofolate dehydrogenase/methenyltetrahydrofolate cyclohydrolase FolD, partial [Candidatus Latescibacteria bacterium]|nr:bifunctional methylenetetrahydrofolate dehydrogenase/methenyltetrahydrofolate cyclohydrolase FolD [Candidatus Latescibacterota bacterium]
MTARILDGKELAADMRAEMKLEVARLKQEHDLVPCLAVVLVGDNPASVSYVKGKQKACKEVGLDSRELKFDADLSEAELLRVVVELNGDDQIDGILVQLSLPEGIDEDRILNAIDPDKDVDGLHPVNLGRLMRGEEGFLPCTPRGVQEILVRSGIEVEGRHVVVVGRSTLVGRPVANILTQKSAGANATVTICHTGTRDLESFTRQADILIVAAGRPRMITAEMVKEGATVIDVGVEQVADPSRKRGYRLVGDVDFDGVREKAGAITPVPGGVGPMTITLLLSN